MSFTDIRRGLRDVLQDNIPGTRIYEVIPQGGIEHPCIIISHLEGFNYLPQLQAGAFTVPLTCFVRVYSLSDAEAIAELESYVWPTGDKSILATLNANHTLNGAVNHAWLSGVGSPDRDPDNQGKAGEWELPFTIQLTHAVS